MGLGVRSLESARRNLASTVPRGSLKSIRREGEKSWRIVNPS